MVGRKFHKIIRVSARQVRKDVVRHRWLVLVTASVVIMGSLTMNRAEDLNYSRLLATIAQAESKGNYNAYYGNAGNTSIEFTKMPVGEVLAWQEKFVADGSPSSAVGKYQFIRPTLNDLVNKHKIDKRTPFNEELQDKLAIALLEKRGVMDYAAGKISREQFAYNLSKEWAGLPKTKGDNPHQSYYAGDGLNEARTSINDVYEGIDKLSQ